MSEHYLPLTVVLALVFGFLVLPLVLSALWNRFHPRAPRGVHCSPAAAEWAESRFPSELRPMAAFVADLIREQIHVGFPQLEPETRFVDDLQMTDMEPVELLMALEEELGIEFPEDVVEFVTVSDLVVYLHARCPEVAACESASDSGFSV